MMSSESPADPARPVLIWSPDTNESHVRPSVEQAAEVLNVSTDDVMAAIASGDLIEGWFVDWEASGSSSAPTKG